MPRHVWQAVAGAYCNQWVPGRDHLWSPLEPTVQGQFDRPQRQQAGSVGTVAACAFRTGQGYIFGFPRLAVPVAALGGAAFCLAGRS